MVLQKLFTGGSVRVELPADASTKDPRTFAILAQYASPSCGTVKNLDGLRDVIKGMNGEEAAAKLPAKGSISFSDLAELLQAPATKAPEPGNCVGWACRGTDGTLAPFGFDRRPCGEEDVVIKICFAGICHSDIHQGRGEWGSSTYPMVPGHEIAGIVTEVGSQVKKFKVGDRVGVGCFVDSCGKCKNCTADLDNHCRGIVFTYNYKHPDGTIEHGGYSSHTVVKASHVCRIPDNIPLDSAAPLLCAGITTFSPLVSYGLNKKGMHIGVLGLGGLGHMAVKFAAAMGCRVTVVSHSPGKKEAALALGAHEFLVSTDKDAMEKAADTLDGIIDTVSAPHQLTHYFPLLKVGGKVVILGVPPEPFQLGAFDLLGKRLSVGGSLIGSIKETQEMLDFCGKHGVTCDIEVIKADYVNEAWDRTVKSDVRYRFVIDVQASLVHAEQ